VAVYKSPQETLFFVVFGPHPSATLKAPSPEQRTAAKADFRSSMQLIAALGKLPPLKADVNLDLTGIIRMEAVKTSIGAAESLRADRALEVQKLLNSTQPNRPGWWPDDLKHLRHARFDDDAVFRAFKDVIVFFGRDARKVLACNGFALRVPSPDFRDMIGAISNKFGKKAAGTCFSTDSFCARIADDHAFALAIDTIIGKLGKKAAVTCFSTDSFCARIADDPAFALAIDTIIGKLGKEAAVTCFSTDSFCARIADDHAFALAIDTIIGKLGKKAAGTCFSKTSFCARIADDPAFALAIDTIIGKLGKEAAGTCFSTNSFCVSIADDLDFAPWLDAVLILCAGSAPAVHTLCVCLYINPLMCGEAKAFRTSLLTLLSAATPRVRAYALYVLGEPAVAKAFRDDHTQNGTRLDASTVLLLGLPVPLGRLRAQVRGLVEGKSE